MKEETEAERSQGWRRRAGLSSCAKGTRHRTLRGPQAREPSTPAAPLTGVGVSACTAAQAWLGLIKVP